MKPRVLAEWRSMETGLAVELTRDTKSYLRKSFIVAEELRQERNDTGSIPPLLKAVLSRKSRKPQHYSPRWTFRILYFRGIALRYLGGLDGLDIGARVATECFVSNRHISGPSCINPIDLSELHVPHYKYYETNGCNMTAIDLLNSKESDVSVGDARCLAFGPCEFDFATIPMLVGTKRCCSHPLEIAIILLELERIVRPGGFAYIADPDVDPVVVFLSTLAGFEVYSSKGRNRDLPLGLIIRKPTISGKYSKLDNLFSLPALERMYCGNCDNELLVHSDLVWDICAPTFVNDVAL